MKNDFDPRRMPRPSFSGLPAFERRVGQGEAELLSEAEQEALLTISRLISVPARASLFVEGDEARFLYNIVSGVVETYCLSPSGDKRATAFLFARDLAGLGENGLYAGSAECLTEVTAFQIPVAKLDVLLACNPRLDAGLVSKLCHEWRKAQRHALTLGKREAVPRVASFLLWMRTVDYARQENLAHGQDEVVLPMSRHDIADYLGLTIESVSRSLHALQAQGLIQRKGPRRILLHDTDGLRALADAA